MLFPKALLPPFIKIKNNDILIKKEFLNTLFAIATSHIAFCYLWWQGRLTASMRFTRCTSLSHIPQYLCLAIFKIPLQKSLLTEDRNHLQVICFLAIIIIINKLLQNQKINLCLVKSKTIENRKKIIIKQLNLFREKLLWVIKLLI